MRGEVIALDVQHISQWGVKTELAVSNIYMKVELGNAGTRTTPFCHFVELVAISVKERHTSVQQVSIFFNDLLK